MIMTLTSIALILATSISVPAHTIQMKANGAKPLGWDLSYTSLLETNQVERDEFLWKWLAKNPRSPVEGILLKWKGEPIISSILMEQPKFNGGERFTLWLVRTKGKVHMRVFVDGEPNDLSRNVPLKFYDDIFKQISSFQQTEPLSPERTPPGGVTGYSGFLSLYDRRTSRQILLTLEDVFYPDELKGVKFKEGRLPKLLSPLFGIRW